MGIKKFGRTSIFGPFFFYIFSCDSLHMVKVIVPVDNHYTRRVTWMDQVAMKMIKEKYEDLKLLKRAKECLFKQFFQAQPLQFSNVIIHQLLLRKIKSSGKNELQCEIDRKYLRFSIGKFVLIT